jgi:chromosome segregation ATPase
MSVFKTATLALVIALGFCCFHPARTLAQTQNSVSPYDHDQTLKQLLTEVRELRLALQRATFSNTHFQMLIERVRVVESHLDSLRRDLDGVRSQISDLQAMKPRLEQQVKDAEDSLDRVTDPNGHADWESRIKSMKAEFARIGPEEERLRTREAALDSELQSSQAKLNELNSQLDSLMNELKAP